MVFVTGGNMYFRRFLANLIDMVILLAVATTPLAVALIWFPETMKAPAGQPPTPVMGGGLIWLGLTVFAYFPLFESSKLLATPGKLLMRFKVIRSDGLPMTFLQALYRTALSPIMSALMRGQIDRLTGGARIVNAD